MFVLGIGGNVDFKELNKIVLGFIKVFMVDLYVDLEKRIDLIKRGICIFGNFDLWWCIIIGFYYFLLLYLCMFLEI